MAQPLYHQHPLQIYFRDVGERSDQLMPGGVPEFASDPPDQDEPELDLIPPSVIQSIRSFLSTTHMSDQTSPFVERFKYDVVSSSLLSSSVSALGRRPPSPAFPGRLTPSDGSESGTPTPSLSNPSSHRTSLFNSSPMPFTFIVVIATLSAGYYIFSALLFGGALYMMHYDKLDTANPAMTSSLDTLNDLIIAGDVWNSVIHEAITALENEERSIYYGPSSPTSPSSPLRIALHSSLHTTQTQCDNVRRLFSALTAPAELSQLSEMYAPPSPSKPAFSDLDLPRPLSLPGSRTHTISVPPEVKRSTWNGSYASLALAGSPTMQVFKHRQKRRSDIRSLLELNRSAVSAPVTPSALSGVREEDTPERRLTPPDESPGVSFGIAALDLHRKRTTGGLETFGLSSSSSPRLGTPTMSSASRFTRMQAARHPLSLSALHHALHGAIASKRYACAHLLALRFNEEDDEGYWEDVRSVMALLTTTFADASSRLTDAIEQAEKDKLRDENPSAESLQSHLGSTSRATVTKEQNKTCDYAQTILAKMLSSPSSSSSPPSSSFAPMPNYLSRFAAHIDAISTALNDAREHIEQCVDSLHNGPTPRPPSPSPTPIPASTTLPETPALQAYERLRRELGLALRECERGREPLLEIITPSHRHRHHHHHVGDPDEAGDPDDLPALGHDIGSDDSDKQDSTSPDDEDSGPPVGLADGDDYDDDNDDAVAHLLLTSSPKHLPPPGIEQVFEADSGVGVLFTRERSKLTREERIRLAKAQRLTGGFRFPSDPLEPPSRVERWGPGGEVVQELKDVIWKVGEKRRKLADGPPRSVSASPAPIDLHE